MTKIYRLVPFSFQIGDRLHKEGCPNPEFSSYFSPLGDGVWSSSDPNLLWIDNQSKFMLPLRAGHVHLQFTPKTKTGVQTSLLGKLTLNNVCSKSSAYTQSRSSASSIMPVGLDLTQEVPIHFALAPVASVTNGYDPPFQHLAC